MFYKYKYYYFSSELQSRYFNKINKDSINKTKNQNLELNLENGTKCKVQEYKAFWCKKQCYVWDEKTNEFSKLASLEKYALCSELHTEKIKGLSIEEQLLRYSFIHRNN
jgi:hypothetical protein